MDPDSQSPPFWPQGRSWQSTASLKRVAHLNSIQSRLAEVTQRKSTILAKHNLQVAGRKREDAEFLQVMKRLDDEEYGLRSSWGGFYNNTVKHHENETDVTSTLYPMTSPSTPTEVETKCQENFADQDFVQSDRSSPLSSATTEILQSSPPQIPTTTASQNLIGGDSAMIPNGCHVIEDVVSGKRHGRPIGCDSMGRPLWKRQSDGNLVYIACPICGKDSFGTLHGIMCHLKAKHKNRKRPERSKLLDVCGKVFTPSSLAAISTFQCPDTNNWEAPAQIESQSQAALLLEGDAGQKGKHPMQSNGAEEHAENPNDPDNLESPVLPFGKQSIASIIN